MRDSTDAQAPPAASHRTSGRRRTGFVANTLLLVGGNVFAQFITIGLMPLITRLYAPEAFGVFSILIAVMGILVPVSSFRYDMAIQLPEDQKDANAITLLCILLASALSLALLGPILIWRDPIAALFKMQSGANLLYVLPALILLGSIGHILDPLLLRARSFKRLALTKIFYAGGDKATSFGLGLAGMVGPGGLIAGRTAGFAIMVVLMLIGQGIRRISDIFSPSSFTRLPAVAARYKEFPKYLWSALLQRLSMQLPILVFGAFFSPLIAGYFAFSRRLLQEPIELVGQGLSRSYYQRAAELHRTGSDISHISERLLYNLAAVTSLPLFLLGSSGTEIFSLAFGAEWGEAGFYTQLLAPIYAMTFLFRPIGSLFDVLEKQREAFVFNVLFLLMSIISLVPGGILGNPLLGVGLFSISTTFLIATRIVWLLGQIGIAPKVSLGILGKCTIRSMVFVSPVAALKYFKHPSQLEVIICACLILISYFAYLFLADGQVRSEMRRVTQALPIFSMLKARG